MTEQLKANILLVDDREDKRMAIESVLVDLGQNIIQASSGREALRHLLKQDFAVILLDVNMPGMDGFETAVLIRQRKASENVPIIFVSAISDAETHVSRGYSLGAVDYILAPIIPEILRSKVSVFVQLFNSTAQTRRQAEELRIAQTELENRVRERTQQLAVANASLEAEIGRRKSIEQDLRNLNSELEERVLVRTEALQTANSELETFTYAIAHDVRAPFRQIKGYAELLMEELSPITGSDVHAFLSRIEEKAGDMERMVDDLLKLFALTKLPFDCEVVELNKIVEEVIAGLMQQNNQRAVEWVVEKLPAIKSNPALIRQVFENLLSNSLKYTRPRPLARIEVGTVKIDNEPVVYVDDNGVGFDMAHAKHLFGVFQRLHAADEFEGTGVGLALVSKIIRRHGGKIWAEAGVGKGAKFMFTLGSV